MKKHSAFSMLEMTIVLIILGIISAGVLKGSSMLNVAKVNVARSITNKSNVANIDGLVAWYETSLIDSLKSSEAYNSGQISTWYDISPSSLILKRNTLTRTASSSLTYVSSGINGLPSLNFSSSANLTLSQFYQGSSANNTIFIVFQPSVNSTVDRVLLDSYSSGSTSLIKFKNQNIYANRGTADAILGTTYDSANFAQNSPYIAAIYLNGASSKAYVSNSATVVGNGGSNPGSNQLTGLTIGTDKAGSNAFTGLISEIIIYNRPLPIKDRQDVFRYLASKYKIPTLGL